MFHVTRGCSSWPINELLWNPGVWCSMLKIEQQMIWLFYLLALMLSRSGNVTKWANDFFREEVECTAQGGPAAQAWEGWHCRPVTWWEFVAQLSCSNWELDVIDSGGVGNCLEALLPWSSSWQESIAWSCWVIVCNIYTLWRMEKCVT